MNATESAMTSTMSTLDLYEAKVEDLHIALREHQAYKECIEFEGDVCDTCVELIADIDAAMFDIEEWNRISTYNTRYVEYVRYVAARAPLTTNTLVVANIVATTGVMPSGDDEDEANAAAYEAHDEEARFAWVLARDLPEVRDEAYIARFNVRYTSIVKRFGRDLNEYLLRLALEEAGASLADEDRKPEPITITDADRIECGKCAGTGVFSLKNARTNETGETTQAVCFPCGGKGWMTRADQWRTNTYWAKYARITA